MRFARSIFIFGLTWLLLLALWFAYTANMGIREVIAGAIAAVISTVAVIVYSRQGEVCFRFRFRDLAQAIYLFWYALDSTWEILHALAKQIFTKGGAPSFHAAVPFEIGDENPVTQGRRALAVTYTTITPNFIVLGIEKEQRLLLYHQILPGEVLSMTQHLGATP